MVLNLQKTVTEQKTIPVPCFWKKHLLYCGLIDENNLYEVFIADDYHSIKNVVPGKNPNMVKTYFDKDAVIIEEAEFWNAYEEARMATDLSPAMAESYLQTITSALQLTPKEA